MDSLTPLTSVVVLAGRRIDAPHADVMRFPLARVEAVARALRATLQQANAVALVASAACGADLLALDVAGEMGIRRLVVLPFPPTVFRHESVVDRPGPWGPMFDRIIADVDRQGDLRLLTTDDTGHRAYEATNDAVLAEGEALAAQVEAPARLAIAVWEGQPRGADDLTAHFVARAKTRGWTVVEVLTVEPDAGL